MRQKEHAKERKASMRFTVRGRILIVIATASAALILSAGVAYGLPYLAEIYHKPTVAEKNLSQTGIKDSKHEMQESSNIEQRLKQNKHAGSGRWIYQGSHMRTSLEHKDTQYLDESVQKWIQGNLTDEELTEWMTQHIRNLKLPLQTVGVMSNQRCLFESEDDIPDYKTHLQASDGIYEFIGLYTEDEVDEEGNLICYYWEAGAR